MNLKKLRLRFCVWMSGRFLTRRPRRFYGWMDCPGWLGVWATLPKGPPAYDLHVVEVGPLNGAPLVYYRR